MVKPYGFKNENNPVKDTYELTIPETVVPIENPTGRQHRLARSIFKKRAARSLYAESLWSILYGIFGMAPARPPATFWPYCTYRHDQRGPCVKSISEIASSNGLFRLVFLDI